MRKHSKFSASGASRWVVCSSSVIKTEELGLESKSGASAIEGTKAHDVAEQLLTTGVIKPVMYCNELNYEAYEPSQEMIDGAYLYKGYIDSLNLDKRYIELQLDLSVINKDMFGTCDLVGIKDKTLYIVDYKFGMMEVSPDNNYQLMLYAVGAISSLKIKDIDNVKLVIVQPKVFNSIKEHDISVKELSSFVKDVIRPAIKKIENKELDFNVGDHCKFCPYLSRCEAFLDNAQKLAKTTFSKVELPSVDSLSLDDLEKVKSLSSALKTWIEEIDNYMLNRAINGVEFKKYKLVKKRVSKKWIDENKAEKVLLDVLKENAYKKKILTPKQALDSVTDSHIKSILEKEILLVDNGFDLVSNGNKRKKIHIETFKAILPTNKD